MKTFKKIILKTLFYISIIILICESDLNAFTIAAKVASLLYFSLYIMANNKK